MNIKNFFSFQINTEDYADFKRNMVLGNLETSRMLSAIVILLEIVLSAVDILSSHLVANKSFHFSLYLFMYVIMILANLIILTFAKRVGDLVNKSPSYIRKIEYCLMAYMIFMLSWGSIVTLIDQQLYGQTMSFIINISICSVIYHFESREMLAVYSAPILILFLGLPFFQSSTNILIGHYVNLSIFILLSFIASRIAFNSYLSNFKSNRQLENINLELKELTLVDDLTKIPNRRNLNAYIDLKYKYKSKVDFQVSIIMIDIDCFKQYNDNNGHIAGDEIITTVAQQIYSIVRHSQDFVARIGGDEFVFISENTGEDGILKIADRIISSIAALKIPHTHSEASQYITLSLGTSTTNIRTKEDIFKCLENADKALYETKSNGRNGVTSYNKMQAS